MSMKIKICCPICGQVNDLAGLPQHIETSHAVDFAGAGTCDDLCDGELMLNLNPDEPYTCGKSKEYAGILPDTASKPHRKEKPCPGSHPFG